MTEILKFYAACVPLPSKRFAAKWEQNKRKKCYVDHAQSIFISYYFLRQRSDLKILPLLSKSCTELCMSNNLYKLLEISPFICKTSSYKKNLQFSKCINPFPTEVRSMAINLSLRVLQNTSWIYVTQYKSHWAGIGCILLLVPYSVTSAWPVPPDAPLV